MNKIVKIVAGVIGVLAIFFLVRIIGAGDEALDTSEELQDSMVTPFMYIAYFILAIVVLLVTVFSLKNMLSNTSTLMDTLKNVGAFVVLAAVAYLGLASGVETEMKDGEMLSAGGSQLIGAGLWLFYFLIIIAVGAMLFTGIKKIIK
ncbi:MAG: hypothetical protein HRT67_02460 [Flavobacteriaceae bacterium]|nr:hypothetical protein [Flavobacteriaceae bacterium]